MKKTLLAAALVMVSGSALAVDGGHIDFNGLVQSGTCKVGVVDAGMHGITTDGVVTLDTANVTDNFAEVGNDSNLLIVFYVQIMPDDFVMQLHR
ncbi:fimbrial protein, partial [Escherichia coli]|nr:fimbrial protein [Escherichia coli]